MGLSARPQRADVFLVVKEVGVIEAFLLPVGQAFGEDVAGALRGQLADQGVLALAVVLEGVVELDGGLYHPMQILVGADPHPHPGQVGAGAGPPHHAVTGSSAPSWRSQARPWATSTTEEPQIETPRKRS
ncbi:hypothetical protein [Nonomuraea dietziae]|uniref:hypothetical protein n=1 Tax=Nonomuraea dietziae TaxID=65515 RepID=UPI003441D8FC